MNDSEYTMDVFREIYIFKLDEFKKWKAEEAKRRLACNKDNDKWKEFWEWNNQFPFRIIDSWFIDTECEDAVIYKRKEIIEHGPAGYMFGFRCSGTSEYADRLHTASTSDGDYSFEKHKEEVDKIYEEIVKDMEEDPTYMPKWWNEPWKYSCYSRTPINEIDNTIIIVGKSDNSIPYEIWEHINRQLNGTNYHLG